jgi:hypothetical protein
VFPGEMDITDTFFEDGPPPVNFTSFWKRVGRAHKRIFRPIFEASVDELLLCPGIRSGEFLDVMGGSVSRFPSDTLFRLIGARESDKSMSGTFLFFGCVPG